MFFLQFFLQNVTHRPTIGICAQSAVTAVQFYQDLDRRSKRREYFSKEQCFSFIGKYVALIARDLSASREAKWSEILTA